MHAVGVLHAVWRAGLAGADVGIVGFDDSELARMHGLTWVSQPLGEVARLALDLVDEALAGDDQPRRRPPAARPDGPGQRRTTLNQRLTPLR